MGRDTRILGIESSCDETAAAVVQAGELVLSNVVSSQIATHQPYGGVVPELASREHLRNIVPVVRQALAEAGMDYRSVDALAVTQGPGLAGALLVGVVYAKALSFALEKPLVAVNHLEGHIHAVLLEERQKGGGEMSFPVLALVVSGGHTHLYLAEERGTSWMYRNIGQTRDDAAGEAYDKVAKLLGLGYPGGPILDRLAKYGDPHAVRFGLVQIKGKARGKAVGAKTRHDFSFSGLKTAVLRYVETQGMLPAIEERRRALSGRNLLSADDYRAACDQKTLDLVASFQRAVVEDLVSKTLAAACETDTATLFVTGGVAANSELRERFAERAAEEGLPVFYPSLRLSTDNAAMIAAAAYPKLLAGQIAEPEFSAVASMRLGD